MKTIKITLFVILFQILLPIGQRLSAQTTGLIFKQANSTGRVVLDPNGDGYVSKTNKGFQSTDTITESEIPYVPVAAVSMEPTSDPNFGPSCAFNDFADIGKKGQPLYCYFDGTNLLFRERLAKSAPNSKAYIILIDTDGKMGNTGPNADPDYTSTNPGFEIEIMLATNFGVGVYNINNNTNTITTVVDKTSRPYEQYCQKAFAYYTSSCGDQEVFYDFYIPISDLASLGVTSTTQLRMVTGTGMSPNPVLIDKLSDFGGIDDSKYGKNTALLITTLVNNQTPASPKDLQTQTSIKDRSVCPLINSVNTTSTYITGTSTETTGTITVSVYQSDGTTLRASGTVSATANWQLAVTGLSPSITLAAGNIVKASVTATGKGASIDNCSTQTVGTSCTDNLTPQVTGVTEIAGKKGFQGSIVNPSSHTINIYLYNLDGSLVTLDAKGNTITNPNTTTSTSWTVGAGTGQSIVGGNYYIVAKDVTGGNCPSDKVYKCMTDNKAPYNATAAAPGITTPIASTATSIAGTNLSGATVYVNINNLSKPNATVTGTTWSESGLSFNGCESISVYQVTTGCISAAATATVSKRKATTPSITSNSYCVPSASTAITISGTSSEHNGDTINIYKAGTTLLGYTTVLNNAWSKSVTVSPGDQITAKAINRADCESESDASTESINIGTTTSNTGLTITTPVEGATSVSGVAPASGGTFTVRLYIDNYNEAAWSATNVANGATWTVSGLIDANSASLLYAGAKLSATVQGTQCESAKITSVEVPCNTGLITTNLSLSGLTPVCAGTPSEITINNSQLGIIYKVYDVGTSSYIGYNGSGTGSTTTTSTGNLANGTGSDIVKTFQVRALRVVPTSTECSIFIGGNSTPTQVNVTVKKDVGPNDLTVTVSPANGTICSGQTVTVSVASSQVGVNYQLFNDATNASLSSVVAGTGGTISLTSSALTASLTIRVTATSGSCTRDMSRMIGVTVNPMPTASITPNPASVCTSGTLNMNGNPTGGLTPYTHVWSGSTTKLSATNIVNPVFSSATTGTYTLTYTVTDNNSCSGTNSISVIVANAPSASVTVSAQNSSICIDNSTNIIVSSENGVSYQLRNNTGNTLIGSAVYGTGSNINLPTGNLTSYTTFNVLATISGCSSVQLSTTPSVTVYSRPTAGISSSNTSICNGSSTTISGWIMASGNWTITLSNGGGVVTGTGSTGNWNKSVSPSSTTTYTIISAVDEYCTSTSGDLSGSEQVTVNTPPTVTAGGGTTCNGTAINITAGGASTYTWSNGAGSGTPRSVSPTTSTTYTVTGTDGNNCTNTANAYVIVNALPTASAGNKQITCPSVSITLNATGGGTYSWSSGSASSAATVTPTVTSTYTVTVTNGSNCTASSSVQVIVATTLYSTNTGSWGNDNNWDVTIVPAPCNNVVISNGHVVDITSLAGQCNNLNVFGTLNINSTSSLTCSGLITNESTGIINITGSISGASYNFHTAGNTVVYNNTSTNQAVIPVKYHHLTIDKAGYTATMTSNDTVNGNLTITAGTLQSTSQNLFVAGDFTNEGAFTHNSGKVIFNGATVYKGATTTTFNDVDIAPGKLFTIQGGGHIMRVINKIRILVSGPTNMAQLAIEDNASQLTGTGANDSVIVQVFDTLDNWHYISAPIDSGYLGAMVYKYFFGKLYNESKNIYEWYNGKFPLVGGRGFAIKWNYDFTYPNGTKVKPSDRLVNIPAKISKLHTGTITYPITYTSGKGDGWNLVGNPYPCAIDWEAASGWNNTNVDPTIYTYDALRFRYTTYNSNTHAGTNGGSRYIPSMQGLYIHCTAAGQWSMDNRVRKAYYIPFWKGNETTPANNLNQLSLLIRGTKYSDESVIAFSNEATTGFDQSIDAYKLLSPEEVVPQISTKTLDDNQVNTAVNFLPVSYMYNSRIPVDINVGVSGSFTIMANSFNGIDPSVEVYLEDVKTKTFTNLRTSTYTFATEPVSNDNRFVVHFGATAPTSIQETGMGNINIYADHDQIVVKNNNTFTTENGVVTVYDVLGKQITERNMQPNTTTTIDMNQSNAQAIYFVKVVTGKQTMTKKVCLVR